MPLRTTHRTMVTLPTSAWLFLRHLAAGRKLSVDQQLRAWVTERLDAERQSAGDAHHLETETP